METTPISAGSSLPPNVQNLSVLHYARTCSQCYELDKRRSTPDGYKWCRRYNRYTKPDHVGC